MYKKGDVKNELKIGCISALLWLGCVSLITTVWQMLEIAKYGDATLREADALIAGLFALSLCGHMLPWLDGVTKKKGGGEG